MHIIFHHFTVSDGTLLKNRTRTIGDVHVRRCVNTLSLGNPCIATPYYYYYTYMYCTKTKCMHAGEYASYQLVPGSTFPD